MNNLLNATIEIVEMSDKAGKFGPIKKIKGKNIETGQTNTYTVYKSKQDGSDTAAWTQLPSIQVMDTVGVGYIEQSGQMPDGKPFTSRIVRNFDKDLGNGRKNYNQHNPAPQAKSSNTGQSVRSGEVSRDEFSRRLGIQGHLNALLSNPNCYNKEGFKWIIETAIEIEDELEKQLNPSPVRQAVLKSNPQFFDDPTNGEHNPMVNDDPELDSLAESVPF